MRKVLLGSVIGVAVATVPMMVFAGEGQTYLNAAAGYQYFDDDRGYDDEVTGIVGLEYQFSRHWAVELRYMQSALDHETAPALDADFRQGGLDFLYYFADGKGFEPYLAFGAWHAELDFDSAIDKADETQFNAGLGVRYLFNNHWSARLDLRGINSLDYETDDALASLGLSYAFGDVAPKSEPAPIFEPMTADSDGDGVDDNVDSCPDTPAGVPVNASGCPLDADADGVPNYRDKCPQTPAARQVDQFGCEYVLKRTEQIKLEVNFPSNSADIPAAYMSEIEKVAVFLKKYGGTSAVIEGHSDSTGADAYNKTLSQRRADAVKDALVKNYGIDASRLSAVGYGEERPIADNATLEGRKANRRVVAVIKAEVSGSQP